MLSPIPVITVSKIGILKIIAKVPLIIISEENRHAILKISNYVLSAMEPITLTTVVTAIAAIFFNKVIEKPGENLGQLLWDKTQNLVARLQGRSPKIAGLLEGSQQQSLDYGEAVLELKALADNNPELAQAIKEVEAAASQESNPEFKQKLQEVRKEADKLKGQQLTIQNLSKLAEKIGFVNQGTIHNQTINQTF